MYMLLMSQYSIYIERRFEHTIQYILTRSHRKCFHVHIMDLRLLTRLAVNKAPFFQGVSYLHEYLPALANFIMTEFNGALLINTIKCALYTVRKLMNV